MEFETFTGITIEGVVFDGTFESSVKIANYLRENAQHRIDKFSINHFNSGSRLGNTNLSFNLIPMKGDVNGKAQEFVLHVGDLLRVQPSNFEVIKKEMLAKYWNKNEKS